MINKVLALSAFVLVISLTSVQSSSEQGETSITCLTASLCNDVSCGRAGNVDNWISTGVDDKCVVKNCTQLLNATLAVSSNSCYSCNADTGNVYQDNLGINCVAVNCVYNTFYRQMTNSTCEICVGAGSIVNSDNSTCTAATSTLDSNKLTFAVTVLASVIAVLLYLL